MRDDISNKSLATLLIVAIVVSIGGTWLVLSKTPGVLQITGLQSSTSTGQINVTIETLGSIRFANNTLNFGQGRVNTSLGNDRCILDTNGTNDLNKCINFTTNGAGTNHGALELENDGSTNATVQLSFDKNADTFLGGSSTINEFRFSIAQNGTENASCTNSTGGYGTSGNCSMAANGTCTVGPDGWFGVNTTAPGSTICQKLLFSNANDSIRVEINITIPFDASSGSKQAILTATATSAP